MKPRNILIVFSVVVLAGLAWLWVTTQPPVVVVAPPVPNPPVAPSRIEAPGIQNPSVAVALPVNPQQTIEGLLSNEALGERELLAGLTKIVLAPARKAEERNEALSHLLNLTDEAHQTVLLALARDPGLEAPLARRLFEDAFNRSLSWQVDLGLVLLERKDMEPLHTAVREHLVFLVGPDVTADSDLNALKRASDAAKKNWAAQAAQ
ncbi:MAG TPA: hypothetical protein VK968_17090 [Roseimicrobium sp.]|nr:hypothetical protein [Roseimicrobium sp.]